MCQAKVYLGDQEIARDVVWLEPTPEGVNLATFFEDPRFVSGRIQRIDFLKHNVILKPLAEDHGRD